MEQVSSQHGPGKKFSIYIDSYFEEDDVIEKDIPEILDYSNSGSEITSNSSLRVKSAPLLSISSVRRRKHREYGGPKEPRQEENYTVTGSGSSFNFVYSTTTYCSSSDSTDSDISTLSSCSEIISISNSADGAEAFERSKNDDLEAPNERSLNDEPETSVDSDPESTASTDKDSSGRSALVVSSSSSGDDRTYLISRNVYTAIPEPLLYFGKAAAVEVDRPQLPRAGEHDHQQPTLNTGYVEYVFDGANETPSGTDPDWNRPRQSVDSDGSTEGNSSGARKLIGPGVAAGDGKYEDVVQKVIDNYRNNASLSMKSNGSICADGAGTVTSAGAPLEILEPPEPFKDGQRPTWSGGEAANAASEIDAAASRVADEGGGAAATSARCWIVDKAQSSADKEAAGVAAAAAEALAAALAAAGRHCSLGRLSNDAWQAARSDEHRAMLLDYLNDVERPERGRCSCCSLGAGRGREECRRASLPRDLRPRSAKARAGHDSGPTDAGNPCRFKRCADADRSRSLSFSADTLDRESAALFRADVDDDDDDDASEEGHFDSRSRPPLLFRCSECAPDLDDRFPRTADSDGDCSVCIASSRRRREPSVDRMKSKSPKSESPAAEPDAKATATAAGPTAAGAGILKSALKRAGSSGSSKKSGGQQKKKHRVQFNESLNKSFEADYVILVRDDDYDEEDDLVGCDCGSQFCYDSCYYLDEGEFDPKCQHLETAPMVQLNHRFLLDTSRFDDCPLPTAGGGPPFEPPFEFVDHVTLSPPDGYKDGCSNADPVCASFTVNTSTMTTPQDDDPPPQQQSSSFLQQEPLSLSEIKQSSTVSAGTEKLDKKDEANYKNNKTGDNSTTCDLNVKIEGTSRPCSDRSAVSAEPESNEEIVGVGTMTKVTERRQMLETGPAGHQESLATPSADPNASNGGILKGGKLWKNCTDKEESAGTKPEPELAPSPNDKRCVKFTGSNEQAQQSRLNDACNCGTDNGAVEERCAPPSNMEYTLTFRLGNRIVPTNSLKPNSAVRQLFPDSKFVPPPSCWDEDGLGKCEGKYLVTEESLRAFNEVNRRSVFSSLKGKEVYPYKGSNSVAENDQEEDLSLQSDLLKKTIERGTLRRSLMRSSGRRRVDRSSSGLDSSNISLEERIKQLTMVDDQEAGEETNDGHGEQSHGVPECRHQELQQQQQQQQPPQQQQQQHSAAGVTGDNHRGAGNHGPIVKGSVLVKPVGKSSAGGGSMYRKFADLFSRKTTEITVSTTTEQHYPYYQPMQQSAGDKSTANEARKQFLSTLTPLKTCVASGTDDLAGRDSLRLPFNRNSIVSTVSSAGTEYSLSDIDEVLRANGGVPSAVPSSAEPKTTEPPDVLAGTPNGGSGHADTHQDELAMFVQQDAGRIERIRKRYSVTPSSAAESEDDEHDDYGFSRRPSVKGIKPRFGSTTEILQQIQQQLQPPPLACAAKAGSHMTWPYYSAECADGRTSATKTLLPTVREEDRASLVGKAGFASECSARLTWETLPPGRRLQPISPVLPGGQEHAHGQFAAAAYAGRVALGPSAANSYLQMKVSPLPVSQVRVPIVGAALEEPQRGASPTTTSIIRVGHGQQQTFRLPCPVSGPVQVHLFHCGTGVDKSAAAAATQFRTNPSSLPTDAAASAHHLHHHHHHHHHQLVIARGTQTAAATTDGYSSNSGHYQNAVVSLLNGPVTAAAVAGIGAVKNCPPAAFIGNGSSAASKAAHLTAYPSPGSQQPSPVPSMTSSPTRMKLCASAPGTAYSQLAVERGIPEGASCSPAFPRDSPVPLVNMAASSNLLPPKKMIVDGGSSQATIVAGSKSSPLPSSFGMKV